MNEGLFRLEVSLTFNNLEEYTSFHHLLNCFVDVANCDHLDGVQVLCKQILKEIPDDEDR